MNNKVILPLESELNELIKLYIDEYKDYIKGDDEIRFSEYMFKLHYLYDKFNIKKKKKKTTSKFKCKFCKTHVNLNEYYYFCFCLNFIICNKCFLKISNLYYNGN